MLTALLASASSVFAHMPSAGSWNLVIRRMRTTINADSASLRIYRSASLLF